MKPPPYTIEALERGDIDVVGFDHEAHVYVAWLYLERYPLTKAIERFTRALKRLTAALGVADKYHETISWFFMIVVAERRHEPGGSDWQRFRADNGDLLANSSALLERYYAKSVLASEKARKLFVLPSHNPAQGTSTI